MLIRFAVENFASFKDMTEFNMMASKIVRHSDHVVSCNGKRVLKSAVLFGPNASGKSNFVKALLFGRDAVIFGLDKVDSFKKYFRLDSSCKDKPGVFQFDIFTNGHFYSYGFAISYQTKSVVEEWLYNIDKEDKEICLFHREANGNGGYEIDSDLSFENNKEKVRFEIYKEEISSKKNDQKMLLRLIADRVPDNIDEYSPFRDVFVWIAKLKIISPNLKYSGIEELLNADNKNNQLNDTLSYLDTGIKSILRKQVAPETIYPFQNPDEINQFLGQVSIRLGKRKSGIFQVGPSIYEFCKESNGEIKAYKLLNNHGDKSELFEFGDESDGTQRMFSLIPIINDSAFNYVTVIDEIDRSLHTEATREIIKLFFSISKNVNSQLIVTTHDTNLLDLDFLRQDEIWFINRKKDCSSELYSLNAFNERFDKKIEKEYLLGRYGAVPNFRPKFLSDEKAGTN